MYLIIGNWKMHPESAKEAVKIYKDTSKSLLKIKNKNLKVGVCVPNVFLFELGKNKKNNLAIGVQDGHFNPTGAETGLTSIKMLASYKPVYGLVGHSEARLRGDDDYVVNQKTLEFMRHKINPIICVGEHMRDPHGDYLKVIKKQIEQACLGLAKKDVANITIAYEPIWAIGNNAKREATPEECLEVTIYIRKVLTDMFGVETAKKVLVIYGGSVDKGDCLGFIEHGGVDGLLVGRASIVPGEFIKIVEQVSNYAKRK